MNSRLSLVDKTRSVVVDAVQKVNVPYISHVGRKGTICTVPPALSGPIFKARVLLLQHFAAVPSPTKVATSVFGKLSRINEIHGWPRLQRLCSFSAPTPFSKRNSNDGASKTSFHGVVWSLVRYLRQLQQIVSTASRCVVVVVIAVRTSLASTTQSTPLSNQRRQRACTCWKTVFFFLLYMLFWRELLFVFVRVRF